jgi:hypothetical protein
MKKENQHLRVEITAATLLPLLAGGQVCAADFRCLDCESKQCLRRLCMQSCAPPLQKRNGRAQAPEPVCRFGNHCRLKENIALLSTAHWPNNADDREAQKLLISTKI